MTAEAGSTLQLPAIAKIGVDAPLRWLAAGWSDLWKAPLPCLTYGLLLALISGGLIHALYTSSGAMWAVILSCGFVFLAPLLAMGIYEVGRQLEFGNKPRIIETLYVRRAVRGDLAYLGLILVIAYFLWGEIGRIIYGLSTRQAHKTAAEFIEFAVSTADGHSMLIAGTMIGGVIAYGVYCIVVVSAPMLLDRSSDVFIAVITSVRAVVQNPAPMALWAAIIVVLTLISFATAFFGLIVILPWLGLASWRAYRELVPDAVQQPEPGL